MDELTTPLVNIGAIARPGVAVCGDHSHPVIVFTIIVGEMSIELIVGVDL